MMLRYFVRGTDIACAERDATARRLVERGYAECSHERYLSLWKMRDLERRAELAQEDAQAQEAPLGNGWTNVRV